MIENMKGEDASKEKLTVDRFVDVETLSEAFETLKEGLSATKRVRGTVKGTYEDVPDQPTRLKAAEQIIAFRLGRPNQNSTNFKFTLDAKNRPGPTSADVVEKMLDAGIDIVGLLQTADKLETDEQDAGEETELIDV